mgnify:CR=1 FL=1
MDRFKLFCTALLQVTFVAMNVTFISREKWILLLITGFCISFIWTLNVRKAAFGDWYDRITYATGAMVGTGIGVLLSNWLIKII